MKIAELRQLLEGTSPKDAKRLVVELYRVLPKKRRESLGIDAWLKNPAEVFAQKKSVKAAKPCVDMDALRWEFDQFLVDAYALNYSQPNKIIPKAQRPKWRFKVKAFFKDINAAVADPANIADAVGMLDRLYDMMCHACDRALFWTGDPFESVGITHSDFLVAVLRLKAQHLDLSEFIDNMLCLVRDSGLNSPSLSSCLATLFAESLPTPESIELAIMGATEMYDRARCSAGKKHDYDYKECGKLNRLAEFGFFAYIKLADTDKAIDFLKERLTESNPEIALLLRLRLIGRKDLWLREYDRAVESGIEPGDWLQRIHSHLKEHGEFPAHF